MKTGLGTIEITISTLDSCAFSDVLFFFHYIEIFTDYNLTFRRVLWNLLSHSHIREKWNSIYGIVHIQSSSTETTTIAEAITLLLLGCSDIVEVTIKHQNGISMLENKLSEKRKWVNIRQICFKKSMKLGDLGSKATILLLTKWIEKVSLKITCSDIYYFYYYSNYISGENQSEQLRGGFLKVRTMCTYPYPLYYAPHRSR